jgi:hypothetical protein
VDTAVLVLAMPVSQFHVPVSQKSLSLMSFKKKKKDYNSHVVSFCILMFSSFEREEKSSVEV